MMQTGWSDVEADIVRLRHKGLTYHQIASETGWGWSTVKSVCRRHKINGSRYPLLPTVAAGAPWTEEEKIAVRDAPDEGVAVKWYREQFPESDRSDMGIRGAYRRLRPAPANRAHAAIMGAMS